MPAAAGSSARCARRSSVSRPSSSKKDARPAGNTIYAAGFLLGVHTSFQKGKNDADSVDAFCEDMLKVSQGQGDKALTRKIAEDCDKALEWLHSDCGVNFAAGSKLVWPMLSRAHLVVGDVKPGGGQLAKNLLEKAKSLKVDLRFSTKAVAILQDEKTGGVAGVRVKTKEGLSEIRAKNVVIATGGYSANNQLVTQFCGQAAAKMPIRGSRIITGENIVLSAPFMPKVSHVSQFHCGPIYGPTGANPLNIVNNGICVNREGQRFTDEGQTYVQMSRDVAAMTPDNWAFMVVDQTAHDIPILANDWESLRPHPGARLHGEHGRRSGRKGRDRPEGSRRHRQGLQRRGEGERPRKLSPTNTLPKAPVIEKAPFYIVPFQGGMTATFGGPHINVNGQVLDTENRPVDGLFAIGNASGGSSTTTTWAARS